MYTIIASALYASTCAITFDNLLVGGGGGGGGSFPSKKKRERRKKGEGREREGKEREVVGGGEHIFLLCSASDQFKSTR